MFNLIETQQALKGLPLPDVMKYANGNNPTVPAYLALSELQRRKQIEDTSSAFYGQQPTVKEQIESGLTSLPQGQVNPTQAPQGVNPTALPPQLAPSPNAPPPQMANPTAPPAGVQPNAAPPVPKMMAEGGLSALPLPHMFRQTSYADGGIVYFGDPEKNPDEEQLVSKGMPIPERATSTIGDMWRKIGGESAVNAIREGYYKNRENEKRLDESAGAFNGMRPGLFEELTPTERAQRIANADLLLKGPQKVAPLTQEQLALRAQQFKTANAPDSDASEQADRMTGNKVLPTAVPANPNKQASSTGSALVKPPAPPALGGEFKSQFDTSQMGKIQSPEEVHAQQQKIRELTGVSSDPMKDIKERYAKLEEKRAKQEAQDPYDSLMNRLAAFSQAKATEGFGAQMGESALSGSKFDKEQQALRDRQATEMNALQLGIAKEDDARRRGDAKGIEDAIAKQKEAQFKLYELQNHEKVAAASYMNAQTNAAELPIKQQTAMASLMHAKASMRPTEFENRLSLLKNDPTSYFQMYPQTKENSTVANAEKIYQENYAMLKNKYPTIHDFLKAQGLSSKFGSENPTSTANLPPTHKDEKTGTMYYLHSDGKYYTTP
jgi:hypothetical protein